MLACTTSNVVTPLVGVWIEIGQTNANLRTGKVTPLVGVWIEMPFGEIKKCAPVVTPLVGVWIEIIALSVQ